MTDDLEAAWQREQAWELRERALADAAETLAMLRQREAPVSSWQPPQPAPVQRQQQPPTLRPVPPPAPPVADEYARPQHDAAGRIVGVERFKGAAAQSARSWEAWIKREIREHVARQLDALGGEVAVDINNLEARMAALAETAAGLTRQLGELQERAVLKPPRLVGGTDADAA